MTGRLDDVIHLDGRNIYPEDIEATAEVAHASVRRGGVVALGIVDDTSERLAVVAEVRDDGVGDGRGVVKAINGALFRRLGVVPHDVVLVAAGRNPKTSSGKPRRSACRAMYLDGRLDRLAPADGGMEAGSGGTAAAMEAVTETERRLFGIWAALLGSSAFDRGDNFVELGGQSIQAQECLAAIETEFGLELSFGDLMAEDASLASLARVLDDGRPAR